MDSIFFLIFDFILYIYNSVPAVNFDLVVDFYKKSFLGFVFIMYIDSRSWDMYD